MTSSARRVLASAAGRAAGSASRAIGVGSGASIAGKVAQRLDPSLLATLARRLPRGCVVVSGTNGKTSTTAMLARVLRSDGTAVVTNETGANLPAGVLSALLRGLPAEIGVLEVDEAASPRIIPKVAPRIMVWTNVLRDQLDRYSEVDSILSHLVAAAGHLRGEAKLVVNADDPGLVGAAERSGRGVVYFGLTSGRAETSTLAADSGHCARCQTTLAYESTYLGHLGVYRCPACGWRRPEPDVAVTPLDLRGARGLLASVRTPEGVVDVELEIGGLSTAFNLGATFAAAHCLGVPIERTAQALAGMSPPFGRGEKIPIGDGNGVLLLMKNPVGGNELLMEVLEDRYRRVLVAVNDGIADGTDVSWLWDVDFERLCGHVDHVMTSGARAFDAAIRLKYAGLEPELVEPGLDRAVAKMAADPSPFAVLATYTAMLEIRSAFGGRRNRVRG